MTTYNTQAPTVLDAPASRGLPPRRSSSPAAVLLQGILHNVAVFAALLALALAPLAIRLFLIMR